MIVLSAIRFKNGGPLSLYRNVLAEIDKSNLSKKHRVVAFVGDKSLFPDYKNILLRQPNCIFNNYIGRLFFGSIFTLFWSMFKKIDYWIDMHDFPSLHFSRKSAVYYHNPSVYLKLRSIYILYDLRQFILIFFYRISLILMSIFYSNIIVQQEWLSKYFRNKTIYVHNPKPKKSVNKLASKEQIKTDISVFFYPALPRVFKGHKTVIDALKCLDEDMLRRIKVIFTMSGAESMWARKLLKMSKGLPIEFVGYLSKDEVESYYRNSDYLLFPSLAETWGLPLSEARIYNLPIIASNKEYVHGPLSNYDRLKLFNDRTELVEIFKNIDENSIQFDTLPGEYKGKQFINFFND